jgi:(S)-sulfolactate dehydrogenase
MRIVAHDPYVEASDPAWQLARNVSLEGLLELSDVVSLHVPLSETTRHLIGKKALSKMKAGAILINAARGGVVDDDALAAALKDGGLGGAALDVFENEPLEKDAGAKFSGISNLVLTPHIAGVTVESNVRVSELVAAKVLEHLEKSS